VGDEIGLKKFATYVLIFFRHVFPGMILNRDIGCCPVMQLVKCDFSRQRKWIYIMELTNFIEIIKVNLRS
jgi:hypothetical protein